MSRKLQSQDVGYRSQIRLPPDLGEWLRTRAEENTRSVNGELIARLKESRKREEQESANVH